MGNPSADNRTQQTKEKTLVTKFAYFKIKGSVWIKKYPKFSIYPPIVKLNRLLGRPICKEQKHINEKFYLSPLLKGLQNFEFL